MRTARERTIELAAFEINMVVSPNPGRFVDQRGWVIGELKKDSIVVMLKLIRLTDVVTLPKKHALGSASAL